MLLNNITRDLLDTLEEETGVHAGFHQNGGLFIASSKERLDEYKRLQTVSSCALLYYILAVSSRWINALWLMFLFFHLSRFINFFV